jgi:hypothetical protein
VRVSRAIKSLEIALQINRAHDAAKSLYGERYQEKVQPICGQIKAVMERERLEPLQALLHIGERSGVSLLFLAAVAEIISEENP